MEKTKDVQKNAKETFYIKNNTIFSSKPTELELFNHIEHFDIPDEINFLKNNKHVLEKLNSNISKINKKIPISGIIENYEETKTKVEDLYKNKKSNFKKPQDDDYTFIEKTSQIDIIDQLIKTSESQDIIDLKKNIFQYIETTKEQEARKNKTLNEQIKEENEKLRKEEEYLEKYKRENIFILEEKIKEEEKQIKTFSDKKRKIEELFGSKKQISKIEEQILKTEEKIERLEYKIEENKLEIEIIKSKISQIDDKIKLGNKKCTRIIPLLLSLGLIYWTKYSDCRYAKMLLHEKIGKIHEKNLLIEKKIHKLKSYLDQKKKQSKKTNIEESKKQDQINMQIEELDEKIKTKEGLIKHAKEEINSKQDKIKHFNENLDSIKLRLKDLENIKHEFEQNSSQKIKEAIENIQTIRESKIERVTKIKKQLENQKTLIDGEYIVEL